jgi:hypothetical protein
MKNINPDAEVAIGKLCNRVSAAYSYIRKVAEAEIKKYSNNEYICATEGFLNNDSIVSDEMIAIFLEKHDCLNESYINIIKDALSKYRDCESEEILTEFQVAGDENKSIMVTNKFVSMNIKNIQNVPLNLGINFYGYLGHAIYVSEVSREEFERDTKDKKNLAFYADADLIDFSKFFVGGRVFGEKFKPACKSTNKIVNILRDNALCERHCVPIIKNGSELIYVWKIGFTDGYTPTKYTERIYKFSSF